MMPLNMMRSAPPDFGDHGRTHRGHGTIRDNRPNKRLGGGWGGGGWPRAESILSLCVLASTFDGDIRTRPCDVYLYFMYALRHLSNAQSVR